MVRGGTSLGKVAVSPRMSILRRRRRLGQTALEEGSIICILGAGGTGEG